MKLHSVNFHHIDACNMTCKYCFRREQTGKFLTQEQKLKVITKLAECFEKITFVGGEPLLDKDLLPMILHAKQQGMTTMVVTNGSLLDDQFLTSAQNYLDWIGISIDSLDENTNKKIGRSTNKGFTPNRDFYQNLLVKIKQYGFKIKINTVVSKLNLQENIKDFVQEVDPLRWKVFQVLKIEETNGTNFSQFEIEDMEFSSYLQHSATKQLVPENNEAMLDSYYMVDSLGQFFSNTNNRLIKSRSILIIEVFDAIQSLGIDLDKFLERGGKYQWDTLTNNVNV
ncbi:Radical_SAM domain protein [Hexamita inflata]|uniref:Radical_SAM domain protein n=1 Tax=Hexamita inflata TaxID=28002 RepID=A0ABP1HF99_9EUKA